jgi:hypothetical protein
VADFSQQMMLVLLFTSTTFTHHATDNSEMKMTIHEGNGYCDLVTDDEFAADSTFVVIHENDCGIWILHPKPWILVLNNSTIVHVPYDLYTRDGHRELAEKAIADRKGAK